MTRRGRATRGCLPLPITIKWPIPLVDRDLFAKG
jgi:hypothetical protein